MSIIESRSRVQLVSVPTVTRSVVEIAGACSEMMAALISACVAASRSTGFQTVEVNRAGDDLVRLVASNEAGQMLVNELSVPISGESTLVTEVVGIRDGSCVVVLDDFDQCLESQGVRSAPPTRRRTGGACQLAAARALAAALVPRRTQPDGPAGEDEPPRRRQPRMRGRGRTA